MDISDCDVPELEGDISSRYTQSIVSISSRTLTLIRFAQPDVGADLYVR